MDKTLSDTIIAELQADAVLVAIVPSANILATGDGRFQNLPSLIVTGVGGMSRKDVSYNQFKTRSSRASFQVSVITKQKSQGMTIAQIVDRVMVSKPMTVKVGDSESYPGDGCWHLPLRYDREYSVTDP